MPIHWEKKSEMAPGNSGAISRVDDGGLLWHAVLRPSRSLSNSGFGIFMTMTLVMMMLPLLTNVGSAVMWVLLPFLLGTFALTWVMLRRNDRDGMLNETLRLWRDRIEIVRTGANSRVQRWDANPHWVRLDLRRDGGPVANYVTLAGAGRTVELGAFLSPDERQTLFAELSEALASLR